jgi:hypothetical protein
MVRVCVQVKIFQANKTGVGQVGSPVVVGLDAGKVIDLEVASPMQIITISSLCSRCVPLPVVSRHSNFQSPGFARGGQGPTRRSTPTAGPYFITASAHAFEPIIKVKDMLHHERGL